MFALYVQPAWSFAADFKLRTGGTSEFSEDVYPRGFLGDYPALARAYRERWKLASFTSSG